MMMAKSKPITGEIPAPDFDAAMAIFNSDIKPANKAQKQAMKEASDAWKIVKKDHRVHTGGFRAAMRIADLEEAEQQAFLRSLYAGMNARGVSLHADLVDNAEGNDSNVFPIEKAASKMADLNVPEGGDDVDEFDAAAPELAAAE
jgi:hypothetical protein